MKHLTVLALCLLTLISPLISHAKTLNQVEVNDDNYLLLSIQLDGDSISFSVDAYRYQDQVLLAIEPFFNSLNLRYQLRENTLLVWKNEEEFTYELSTSAAEGSKLLWANDGYYQFISEQVIADLFSVSFNLNTSKLSLNILSGDYLFPVTIIEQQRKERYKNQAFAFQNNKKNGENPQSIPITVEDQYHLLTLPHGEIFSSIETSDDGSNHNTNIQMTSDLLYHSARINLSKSKGKDVTGGISLSKYKTSPNNRILGAFDFYSFGDISSYSSGTILNGQSGVGFNIQRSPLNYRQSNSKIDIQQRVPPGWEAELFLNNRLVTSATAPDTGLLVFTDMDIYYGRNDFVIKVYGPFGETEEYNQSFPLKANPLAAGDMAYGLYALDNQRNIFTGNNDLSEFKLDSMGGAFNYGISDQWQVGAAFQNVYDEETQDYSQIVGLKNFLSFPGALLETDIASNNDSDYAFTTSLSGRLFGTASYQLELETLDGLDVNTRGGVAGEKGSSISGTYLDFIYDLPLQLTARYNKTDTSTITSLVNNFYYNFKRLRFTHRLSYANLETNIGELQSSFSNLSGALGISGTVMEDFRLSAEIQYDPERSDPILDSSRITAQYRWSDPFDLKHYFTFNYQPLSETGSWRLSHNLAFETPDYRLSFRSNYNSSDTWSFGLNVNFFLGYDYHNNSARTSSNISGETAALNIHSYLDRQLNGVPDVLDYPLEGVEFFGNNNWQNIRSGKSGKVLLHGARVNSPFRFGATWQNGSQTINNDYVVYTHPGARIDVNMPFYLTTELSGFVYRQTENGEIPVTQLMMMISNDQGEVIEKKSTDEDGYFEFIDIHPNQYLVTIDQQSLHDKALTADILGFSMTTPNIGGFTELPTLYVSQQADIDSFGAESIQPLVLTEDNVEVLVWDEDEQKRKNFFTLPTDKNIQAEHVLPENKTSSEQIDEVDSMSTESEMQAETIKTQLSTRDLLGPSKVKEATPILTNFYTLQLGSFLSRDSAVQFISDISSRLSSKPTIIELQNNKFQTIYKVFYGKFNNSETAAANAQSMGLSANAYMIKPLTLDAADKIDEVNSSSTVVTGSMDTNDSDGTNGIDDTNSIDETNDIDLLQNWVIQFYASKSQISPANAARYSAIGDVFVAEKTNNTDEVWLCLISRGFATRGQAEQALQESNLNGWVNASKVYSNVKKVQ